jgi:SAM-dependent methyltransferase
MANPLCRETINRRVTGSPDEWPLDWFRRVHGSTRFLRGVSFGCGQGAFERWAVKLGLVREVDAFDISSASLEDARRLAREEGVSGIRYALGSFDEPQLADGVYDIAFFHASLHHVANLEGLFEALSRALKPGGAIYVDDYVGRSRHEWRGRHLRSAQEFLDRVPLEAKSLLLLDLPVARDDPSEAARSSEVEGFLRGAFDLLEWKPYGGQITAWVLPWVDVGWTGSAEGRRLVAEMLAREEEELARDASSTDHAVAYGVLKPPRRAASLRQRGSRFPRVRREGARVAFHVYWIVFKVFRRIRSEIALRYGRRGGAEEK